MYLDNFFQLFNFKTSFIGKFNYFKNPLIFLWGEELRVIKKQQHFCLTENWSPEKLNQYYVIYIHER